MGKPKGQKVKEANVAAKSVEALQLYIGGHTFRQIAERMDISLGSAHGYVKTALQEAAKQRADLSDAILEAQVERLNDAMQRVTNSRGYQDGDPQSINAFVKVCESLRKLLGLDMPSKVDVTSDGEAVKYYGPGMEGV